MIIERAAWLYNRRIRAGEVASVRHLFDLAGQDPNSDLVRFNRHLNELAKTGVYTALLDEHDRNAGAAALPDSDAVRGTVTGFLE